MDGHRIALAKSFGELGQKVARHRLLDALAYLRHLRAGTCGSALWISRRRTCPFWVGAVTPVTLHLEQALHQSGRQTAGFAAGTGQGGRYAATAPRERRRDVLRRAAGLQPLLDLTPPSWRRAVRADRPATRRRLRRGWTRADAASPGVIASTRAMK